MNSKLYNIEQIMRDHDLPHLKEAISNEVATKLDVPHWVSYEVDDGVVYRFDPPEIHFYPLGSGRKGFQIAYLSQDTGEAQIWTYHNADLSGYAYTHEVDAQGDPVLDIVKVYLDHDLPTLSLPSDFVYEEPEWPDNIRAPEKGNDGPIFH